MKIANRKITPMNKRISVILPTTTVAVLDRVAAKGSRSALIDRAIRRYVETRGRRNLRERLKQEALANAGRDLRMAAEWFPLEEEAWQVAQGRKSQPGVSPAVDRA
ncbi:MAG: hypothetical protein ABSF25_25125 [Bryobacteraceae bacterium]